MTKAHDERFNTPPAIEPADPKDHPKGFKPGDPGYLEALLQGTDIKFEDKVERK